MSSQAENEWRRLALQFDGHLMQALDLLRDARDSGLQNRDVIDAFLAAPPLSGEKVLADRIAAVVTPQQAAKLLLNYLCNVGESPVWEIAQKAQDASMSESADIVIAAVRAVAEGKAS